MHIYGMSSQPGKRQAYGPNRSCERCRSLKIRCLQSESPATHTCQRCTRLNVECVYALPAKRRPRKRTDTKVAELEREVKALSSILRKQHGSSTASTSPEASTLPDAQLQTPSSSVSRNLDSITPDSDSSDDAQNDCTTPDVIASGLLSYDMACEIFNVYVTSIVPRFPVVPLPLGSCMDSIRATRPTLFLAILATASKFFAPDLCSKLHGKIASVLALKSMVNGSSSLDLLQALIVTTVWYFPGRSYDQLKYQQYSHMVAGVASQIGIDRKRRRTVQYSSSNTGADTESPGSQSSSTPPERTEEDDIEEQRTLLSCYLLCAGISRSLHRPTIFPFSKWMSECVDNLETSPFAAPTDVSLVHLINLQRIMVDSNTALGMDDPSVSVDVSESRIQQIIQFYDNKLEAWFEKFSQGTNDQILQFLFHCDKIVLHESAMYSDHDPEDFKPPFSIERISKPASRSLEWRPAHIRYLSICWANACMALDLFLQMSAGYLRASPDKIFVRMIYCIVVLVKLSVSSASRNCALSGAKNPFSEEHQFARVVSYIDKVVPLLRAVADEDRCPIAGKFGFALLRIKDWSARQAGMEISTDDTHSNLLEPLRDLSFTDKARENSSREISVNAKDSQVIDGARQTDTLPLDLPEGYTAADQDFRLDWEYDPVPRFDFGNGFSMQSPTDFFGTQGYDFGVHGNTFDTEIFDWTVVDGQNVSNGQVRQ